VPAFFVAVFVVQFLQAVVAVVEKVKQ